MVGVKKRKSNVVDLNTLRISINNVVNHNADTDNAREVFEDVGKALAGLLNQIEQAEGEWRAAFDAIQYPIFFHDSNLRIIRANKAYADKAGLPINEIIGKAYWEIFPKTYMPLTQCSQTQECRAQYETDEIVTIEGDSYLSRSFGVKDEKGKYRFSVHVLENISAQRHFQQVSEENILRYRQLFESSPDAVFLADADTGQILDANPAAEQLTGRSRIDLLKMTQAELHPPGDIAREDFREHVSEGREGRNHKPSELHVQTASGNLVPVEITSRVFEMDGRQVIQGIFRDVSLRKESEARLRLHAQILSQIHDSVISTDLHGVITVANKSAEKMFGYSEEEMIGRHFSCLFSEHERGVVTGNLIEKVRQVGSCETELSVQHKDGRNYFVHFLLSHLRDMYGSPEGMIACAMDISQQKHAEDELHETGNKLSMSLNLLGNIIESVPMRVFWKDKNLRYAGCNTLFAKDAGFNNPGEIVGKDDYDTTWKEMAKQQYDEDSHIVESKLPRLGYEEARTLPEGKTAWLNISKVPLRNDSGEIIGVLGIYDDITKQKQARQNILLNERRLKEAQAVAHIGNWELDVVHNRVYWSDELCRIYEMEPCAKNADFHTFFDRVHPEDRERVERGYNNSIGNKLSYETTFRLLMPNGDIKYLRGKCESHDGGEHMPRAFGTMQDITEQHLTEQALTRSNMTLKAISSSISALVHADNEAMLLDDMCHVIINTGGYRFAWIGYVDDGVEVSVRPVAQAGFESGYLNKLNVTSADTERGRGPAGRTIRTGKSQVVKDILVDDSFQPWRAAAVECGYRSVLCLPVKNLQGEVFAIMGIYSDRPDAFDKDAIALMENLAGDLGFGILSLRTRKERDHYLQAHQKSDERFKQVLVDTIHAISLTVEKRDPYTAGHQYKVAQLSVAIGLELGLNADRLEGLRLGAMIHDIGKIYVPAEILNRPGRLTKAEFEIIKSHSEVGYDIIKNVQFPWPVRKMVLQHHERLNGSGYPNGLQGDEIILEARILMVADVVEAITSHRPYRPAVGLDKALLEIEKNRGILYDMDVVDACLHLIRDKDFTFQENGKS